MRYALNCPIVIDRRPFGGWFYSDIEFSVGKRGKYTVQVKVGIFLNNCFASKPFEQQNANV